MTGSTAISPQQAAEPARAASLAPAGWRRKVGNYLWGARQVLRRGVPSVALMIRGGIGDQFLLASVARELRRRGRRRLWVMSSHPELFRHNPDIDQVVVEGIAFEALTERLGGRVARTTYAEFLPDEDRHTPPSGHIITRMCALAGVTGEVSLRPYLTLTEEELEQGFFADRQICVMSSGLAARSAMLNKEWGAERFQAIVDQLADEARVIQLGAPTDPPLQGALDLRGHPFRASAAVLAHSCVFIGQEGFLMHLARAVECPSVIVYGGRVHPTQTGYACNESLYTQVSCAPCWQLSACDRERECLAAITPAGALEAVARQLARWPAPGPERRLPTESAWIGEGES